ncbi:hypothetical protein GCM10023229_31870 [Flavisolibacter ginsenosidimutans]
MPRYYANLKRSTSLLLELFMGYIKITKEKSMAFNKTRNPFLFFEKNISLDQYIAIKMKDTDFIPSFRELVTNLQLIVD